MENIVGARCPDQEGHEMANCIRETNKVSFRFRRVREGGGFGVEFVIDRFHPLESSDGTDITWVASCTMNGVEVAERRVSHPIQYICYIDHA